MNYLTDGHALLWHLYWPQRLGGAAQRVFSDADTGQVCIHVPAVVVAEALMVVQKRRLPGASLDHLLRTFEQWLQVITIRSRLCYLKPSLPVINIRSFPTSSIASSSPKRFHVVFRL